MTASSDLVLYRAGASRSLTTKSFSSSLISSNLFSQQTGTAIATELLYRLLFDILNRFLFHFQRLAAKGIDEASSFIERKLQERRDRLEATRKQTGADLRIVEEVGKLAGREGFVTCPMTRARLGEEDMRGPPGPPMWVCGVLEGIEEGRLGKIDFETNQW